MAGYASLTPRHKYRSMPQPASIETFYMFLLNEGTDVWRPVDAEPLGGGKFRVLGPVPDDEEWEFEPGSIVACEMRLLSSGPARVAIRLSC